MNIQCSFKPLSILWLLAVILTGCTPPPPPTPYSPMVESEPNQEPLQVVTYQNERIIHDVVKLVAGRVERLENSVYITENAQFVYKDGSPIIHYSGDLLFWDSSGDIVNASMVIIPEPEVFKVNNMPMRRHSAMMLKQTLLNAQRSTEHQLQMRQP